MITGTTDEIYRLLSQNRYCYDHRRAHFSEALIVKKGSCISQSDLKQRHYTDYHIGYLNFSADNAAPDWPWLKQDNKQKQKQKQIKNSPGVNKEIVFKRGHFSPMQITT